MCRIYLSLKIHINLFVIWTVHAHVERKNNMFFRQYTFCCDVICDGNPLSDNKVHVANMGPIWGRQDPGGPHVGPINFAIGG